MTTSRHNNLDSTSFIGSGTNSSVGSTTFVADYEYEQRTSGASNSLCGESSVSKSLDDHSNQGSGTKIEIGSCEKYDVKSEEFFPLQTVVEDDEDHGGVANKMKELSMSHQRNLWCNQAGGGDGNSNVNSPLAARCGDDNSSPVPNFINTTMAQPLLEKSELPLEHAYLPNTSPQADLTQQLFLGSSTDDDDNRRQVSTVGSQQDLPVYVSKYTFSNDEANSGIESAEETCSPMPMGRGSRRGRRQQQQFVDADLGTPVTEIGSPAVIDGIEYNPWQHMTNGDSSYISSGRSSRSGSFSVKHRHEKQWSHPERGNLWGTAERQSHNSLSSSSSSSSSGFRGSINKSAFGNDSTTNNSRVLNNRGDEEYDTFAHYMTRDSSGGGPLVESASGVDTPVVGAQSPMGHTSTNKPKNIFNSSTSWDVYGDDDFFNGDDPDREYNDERIANSNSRCYSSSSNNSSNNSSHERMIASTLLTASGLCSSNNNNNNNTNLGSRSVAYDQENTTVDSALTNLEGGQDVSSDRVTNDRSHILSKSSLLGHNISSINSSSIDGVISSNNSSRDLHNISRSTVLKRTSSGKSNISTGSASGSVTFVKPDQSAFDNDITGNTSAGELLESISRGHHDRITPSQSSLSASKAFPSSKPSSALCLPGPDSSESLGRDQDANNGFKLRKEIDATSRANEFANAAASFLSSGGITASTPSGQYSPRLQPPLPPQRQGHFLHLQRESNENRHIHNQHGVGMEMEMGSRHPPSSCSTSTHGSTHGSNLYGSARPHHHRHGHGVGIHRQNSLGEAKVLLAQSDSDPVVVGHTDVIFSRDFINEGFVGSGTFADVYKVRQTFGSDPLENAQQHYAVKKSKRQFKSKRDRDWLLNEVRVMKLLCLEPCEYIVQFIRAWQEESYFYVQIEFADRGNLKDLVNNIIADIQGRRPHDSGKSGSGSYKLQHTTSAITSTSVVETSADYKKGGININHGSRDSGSENNNRDEGVLSTSTLWHIAHDVLRGLEHIHNNGVVHLDIKPQNLLISNGVVKIADFGMAAMQGTADDGHEGDTR